MSTPPTTLPESRPAARREAWRWLPRLRDARIRSKLALILVVPVAAVVALSAARLVESGQRASEASLVQELAGLATDVSALAHETHRERMSAARLLSAPGVQDPSVYNAQVRRTDERIATYNSARKLLGDVPAAVEVRLDRIDEHLATLNGTRQDVISNDQVSISEAILRYGVVITDLVSYGEVIGQIAGEGDLADSLRAMSAFANAKAATAEEQAVVYGALASGNRLDDEQFSSFVATLTSQQEALLSFSLAATGAQRELVNSTVTGDAVILADQASSAVSRSVGKLPQISAEDAARSVGAVNDLMRWSEIQMEGVLLADAKAVRDNVLRQVLTESVLVLITLAVAIALAVVLARSMVRSLTRLREGALSVAGRDLPNAVARLRDVRSLGEGGVEAVTSQIHDPIRLPNKDEVGQVAQAFNVVHREAVRIAAEQAALRTSVSAMFLNLARRSQALVDRMIGELDHIERTEEDPKRLAQLFQLDHLATRMRRNDENLLVLAGADSTPPRREDALLIDAVRAAQSEVELYNRIEFGTVDSDIYVAAHAVNDVVRLLAELLDNATRFSPPTTIVVAEARRIRDYVLIQIEDRGLGINEEQIESLNRRLAEPPSVDMDVAAFRLMGLAVVGRLAARYGVGVELRQNTEGGTVAHISLPSGILVLPQHRAREVLAAATRPPRAVEPGPARTAPTANPATANTIIANTIIPHSTASITAPSTAAATGGGNGNGGAVSWSDDTKPALPTRTVGATAFTNDTWTATPSKWDAPESQSQSQSQPQPSPAPSQVTAAHPTLAPAADSPYAAGYGAQLLSSAYAAPTSPPPTPPTPPRGEEMPIFREMEASWFRTHDAENLEPWAMPTAGHPPPPSPATVGGPTVVMPTVAPAGTADKHVDGYQGYDSTPARAAVPGSEATAQPPAMPYTGTAVPASLAPGQQSTMPYTGTGVAGGPTNGVGASGGSSTATGDFGAPEVPPVSAQPLPPQGYTPPAVPAAASAAVPKPRTSTENGWQTRADEGWRRAMEAAAPSAGGTTRSGLPKRVPQAQLVPGGVTPSAGRDHTRRTPEEVRGLLSAYHRGVQRGRLAGEASADQPSQIKETRA